MSDNEKIREIRARLNAVAPLPEHEVRAFELARHFAVRAQERWARQMLLMSGPIDYQQLSAMCAEFAAAHALYALVEAEDAPGYSAHIAMQIRDALLNAPGVGEWLFEHLGEETCEQVTALAEELAEAQAAS